MTKEKFVEIKLNHKAWIQSEIIQLEVEGNVNGVKLYQADLVRIDAELESVGVK